VTALAARPVGTDGAEVSGHAEVDALTVALVERLPAASTASTASVYEVPQVSDVSVELVPDGDATSVLLRYTP
jgi:hypothetical protein